jgi:2'-5' RNA ligase
LKFLGQTWPRLRGWVEEHVAAVASSTAPIPTRLTSIGAFPGGRRARVVWAGVDDTGGRLTALASGLDGGLAEEFRPESRPYAAHCTIARSDPPLHLDEGDLSAALRPVAFTVERVVLFRSHLRRPAPRYEPIATFPLAG